MKKVEMVATVNTPKNVLAKKFDTEVKNYLSMTTDYTKCYKFGDDNFKVDANDDYIEIVFHGNLVTFYCTGKVRARFADKEFDDVEIGVFKDIMDSIEEMWMMYISVFDN
jgi:hypothetical protein